VVQHYSNVHVGIIMCISRLDYILLNERIVWMVDLEDVISLLLVLGWGKTHNKVVM